MKLPTPPSFSPTQIKSLHRANFLISYHFIEAKTHLRDIVIYYLCLLPSSIEFIAPISLLLAVLYSLSQLTKNNEVTAMRASGISIYRIMLPFVMISFFISIFVLLINETIAPSSAYWTQQFIRYQKSQQTIKMDIAKNLAYNNEMSNRIWLMEEFNTRTYTMKNVTVTQEREDGSSKTKLQAVEGYCLDGRWWFSDVAIQEYDPKGNPIPQKDNQGRIIGSTRYVRQIEMGEWDEQPREFMNEIKDPAFLSSLELIHFLDSHQFLSEETTSRIKVDLHNALAMPWTCIIVTLIGIPFGVHTGRRGAFLGVALSIALFFGFYFLIPLGIWLGKQQIILPWIAGWLPNLLFLSISIVLIYRMR